MKTGNILVFKVNQLGDNVVFKPVIDRLLLQGEKSRVHLFTSLAAREIYEKDLAADHLHGFATSTFKQAWKRPFFFLRLLGLVLRIRPAICLLPEDQGNVAHLLALLSGARVRIGVPRDFIKVPFTLTRKVTVEESSHPAVWGWKILQALYDQVGWPRPEENPPAPNFSAFTRAGRRLDFLIHAGASLEYKRWFLPRFVKLANRLAETRRVGWIVLGEPEEEKLDSRIEKIPTPKIKDLIAIISEARILVGNNSGPMNLAQGTNTAVIVFCGPSPRNWDPFWHQGKSALLRDEELACICCDPFDHPKNYCTNRSEPMACMKRWEVDDVFRICSNQYLQLQNEAGENSPPMVRTASEPN